MPSGKSRTPRVDREHRKTDRALELFLLLQRSKFRIPLAQLTAEKWGSRKTITRTVEAINAVWGRICGETLIEIVREDGSIKGPGERYLQLVDHNLRSLDIRGLAVYQAYLGMTGFLRETVFHHMMSMQLDRLKTPLLKSERAKLTRMGQKFYAVMSQHARYSGPNSSIVAAIFDALIDERILEAQIATSTTPRTINLQCLTLFSRNDQLYLLAQQDDEDDTRLPMILALRDILFANVLTHQPFTYPLNHEPARILQDLIGNDTK